MAMTGWICIGAGTIVLLIAAATKKDAQHCKGIEVIIKGAKNNCFIDEKDVLNSIASLTGGTPTGKPIGSFNLKKIEIFLEKDKWVKHAELFFDNNGILEVKVLEREPIARIFTMDGNSFYIDNSNLVLPLSEKFPARVPLFTNFPRATFLSKNDSDLLGDIKMVSLAIQSDPFRMAMIEQVDITPQGTFEMIPKIGNQLIRFGEGSDAEAKFVKLQLFYKNIMLKTGWNWYSVIDLQYKNQVVAKRRGAEDKSADSLRTLQLMQLIAANAEKSAADSIRTIAQDNEHNTADSSMMQQSIQRDETNNSIKDEKLFPPKPLNVIPVLNSSNLPSIGRAIKKNAILAQKPMLTSFNKPTVMKQKMTSVKQGISPKPVLNKQVFQKPKITMPAKNDY